MPVIAAQPYEYTFPTGKLALVVIDMQRDFVEEGGFGSALGNDVSLLAAIVPTVRRLLDGFRAAGLPVIHTREGHRPDLHGLPAEPSASRGKGTLSIGDEGPMGRILIDGEPGNDLVPELAALPGETVIVKPGKGAFYATPLGDLLETQGIEPSGVRRRHHRGLRADHDARGQRPRLRMPAGRGRDRELLPRVQGGHARHDPRPGRHRRLDRADGHDRQSLAVTITDFGAFVPGPRTHLDRTGSGRSTGSPSSSRT